MSENYIVINGKRAELTEEQLKALGIEIKRKNPFERVAAGDRYYFISYFDDVDGYTQANDCEDDALFNNSNYFNDESFAKQVALHQLLYRKLLKFAYDNECEDTAEWDLKNMHYYIYYDYYNHKFDADVASCYKENIVYFSSRSAAERAIKEVVGPFMEEYPDFVWL